MKVRSLGSLTCMITNKIAPKWSNKVQKVPTSADEY